MAVYAIGDVQGCDEELAALLERVHFNADRDRLWFVGDLVNRGPASLAALRRVHALRDNAVVVLGNHDLHLLAVARSSARHLRSGDTLEDILQAPDRDRLLDWLQSRPLFHHDPKLNYTLIHAGLPPQWDGTAARNAAREVEHALAQNAEGLYEHLYGDKPEQWSEDLRGYERLRFIVNCLTRMRFCDPNGRIDLKLKGSLERAPAPYLPWFRVPGRRSETLRIVCGHWSAIRLHFENNVFSIDAGCVWGGKLCALRLDATQEPISVGCGRYQNISE